MRSIPFVSNTPDLDETYPDPTLPLQNYHEIPSIRTSAFCIYSEYRIMVSDTVPVSTSTVLTGTYTFAWTMLPAQDISLFQMPSNLPFFCHFTFDVLHGIHGITVFCKSKIHSLSSQNATLSLQLSGSDETNEQPEHNAYSQLQIKFSKDQCILQGHQIKLCPNENK